MYKNIFPKFRRISVALIHLLIIVTAYVLSFYLRFDLIIPKQYVNLIFKTLPGLIIIKMVIFYYFKIFSGLWKYVNMDDLWRIIRANIAASSGVILYIVFLHGLVGFPRSIFVIDFGVCIFLVSGIRFITRGFREYIEPRKYQKYTKVLVIGAGEAGVMVLNELRKNMNYNVVGFIDDDASKWGMSLSGRKIFGGREKIKETVGKYGIEEIILAMPSQSGSAIRSILVQCQVPGIKIQIVPGMYKILSGELEVKLRNVEPEDLLGREAVEIDKTEISSYIKGKNVLVTGAAGSIGSELCRQIASYEPEKLIMFDLNENDMYFLELELVRKYPQLKFEMIMGDVKDIGLLKHVFSKSKIQIIFHAAAYKHVPMMEIVPSAAVKNNIIATRNLIYAANHYHVEKFIFISTDKAVNPISVMGISKRIGEMLIQAKAIKSKTKFIAVRFGNVLGSKGSVVPLFKEQIKKMGPVTVTHPDAKRYFMSVVEAVELVLEAGAIGSGGEILVLDMGEQINIYELAKNLITLSGCKPHEDIDIVFSGLRPGEKLFEETFHDAERDIVTKHDKIYVARPEQFDIKKLIRDIKCLENLAKIMDERSIIENIKKIIPTDRS